MFSPGELAQLREELSEYKRALKGRDAKIAFLWKAAGKNRQDAVRARDAVSELQTVMAKSNGTLFYGVRGLTLSRRHLIFVVYMTA